MNKENEKMMKQMLADAKKSLSALLKHTTYDDEIYSHIIVTMAVFLSYTTIILEGHDNGFSVIDIQKAECAALRKCADSIEVSIRMYEERFPEDEKKH